MLPFTAIFIVLIFVVSWVCWSSTRQGGKYAALALAQSLLFAQLATFTQIPEIATLGLIIGSVICLLPRTKICDALAFIYGIRLLIIGAMQVELITPLQMWASTFPMVALQLLVAFGGYGHWKNGYISYRLLRGRR